MSHEHGAAWQSTFHKVLLVEAGGEDTNPLTAMPRGVGERWVILARQCCFPQATRRPAP
jgi:hypothetical protein